MFTECKITEIFFMADEFCKFFDATVKKNSVEDKSQPAKRPYHRASTLLEPLTGGIVAPRAAIGVVVVVLLNSAVAIYHQTDIAQDC